jgi:hypothetical protein
LKSPDPVHPLSKDGSKQFLDKYSLHYQLVIEGITIHMPSSRQAGRESAARIAMKRQ